MRLKWRIISIVAVLLLAAIGAYCIELAVPKHDYFLERVGSIRRDEIVTASRSGPLTETLQLESSTGFQVDMRILRPRDTLDRKLPLVLVLGGYKIGKDAVDLVGDPHGVAYAAIDYPQNGNYALDEFWGYVAAIPDVQRVFLDTPPSVLLALDWLLQQAWVDPDKVELVGVSLGVPFAAVAGALDDRFSRVWLMHGGGDNITWVMHLASDKIENETLRYLAASGALFAVYGNSFDTRRWIPKIAPRPLIIVAARDDQFVPRASQEPFVEAAKSEHVELLWTEGQHVGPDRQRELQLLLEIIANRIDASR